MSGGFVSLTIGTQPALPNWQTGAGTRHAISLARDRLTDRPTERPATAKPRKIEIAAN
jgi:hypothetical protein